MRFGLGLLGLGLLSACAHGAAPYQSFSEVPYGLGEAQDLWCDKAQLWIHVEALGPKDSGLAPLVLLHPWGLNMTVWAEVAPRLAQDRRVLLIDLPGHGKSDKLHTAYPMTRLAQAVLDVMDKAGIDKAVVAGNSLGGATSIAVAERAPHRVQALVLIAAPGGAPLAAPILKAVQGIANPVALGSLSDEAWFLGVSVVARSFAPLPARLRDDLIRLHGSQEWAAWSRATIAILRNVAVYQPRLERLAMPTLVVHGSADLLITERFNRALAERIPNAHLHTLQRCGHMPEVECPDALLKLMLPFLGEVGRSPAPT